MPGISYRAPSHRPSNSNTNSPIPFSPIFRRSQLKLPAWRQPRLMLRKQLLKHCLPQYLQRFQYYLNQMGNQFANNYKSILTSFPQHFHSLGPIHHPIFGDSTLHKHTSNSLVIETSFSSHQLIAVKSSYEHDHANVVSCLGYKASVCFLQFLPSSLYSNLELKIQLTQPYPEAQLWYFLYQLTSGLNYLHAKNEPVGDISLDSIFLDRNGSLKLLAAFRCETEKRYWKQEMKYVDPLLHSQLEQNERLTQEQNKENDIFSLSVVMLELLTLNVLSKQIKIDNIDTFLQGLSYSRQLLSFIAILTYPFQQRPTANDLFEILHLYHQQILNFQSFKIKQDDLLSIDFAKKYIHQKLLNSRLILNKTSA